MWLSRSRGITGILARSAAGLLVAFCFGFGAASAAELTTPQVKARYIHNFVKYITWPEAAGTVDHFSIGVLGAEEVQRELEAVVRGKNWRGKPFQTNTAPPQAPFGDYHILYINESNRDRISEILQNVPQKTLTIGEGPSFLARGGMIEFKITEGKVRFRVNLKALRDAGFNVDSKLLSVAEEVQGK